MGRRSRRAGTGTETAGAGPPVTAGMTSGQRGRRLAAAAAGLALVLAGTVRGLDDHFPFGPMRMYAYANKPDGEVTTAHLRGVTQEGRVIPIRSFEVGLRRAELEGQRDRFAADPRYLRALARVYEERKGTRLVELRLEQWVYDVVDRRVQGDGRSEVLSRWSRR